MRISTSVNLSYKYNLTLKNKSKSLFTHVTKHIKEQTIKIEIWCVSYIIVARISKN